jgi:hypothetical protein
MEGAIRWTLNRAEFLDLGGTGQLSKSIADEDPASYLLLKDIARVGEDRGYTGTDIVPFDKRGIADSDACDVGNGVQSACGEDARGQAQIAGSRPRLIGPAEACGANQGKELASIHIGVQDNAP